MTEDRSTRRMKEGLAFQGDKPKRRTIAPEDLVMLEKGSRLNVLSEFEQGFIFDMKENFFKFQFKMACSEKQVEVLRRLAGRYDAITMSTPEPALNKTTTALKPKEDDDIPF